MASIKLPQLAWYGARELELTLPDSWQVEVCNMTGGNRPALGPDEIRASVGSPIGIIPIRDLARGKKEVVIIFDDMTRITRVAEIVPFVLEELYKADVPHSSIRFVCALGCHGALNRLDFAKKLGEETLARFPVYNHNPFGNCTYVGTTSTYGTEVYINEEVMKCDFKIVIGSVVPHPMSGFSGGGKIILPGVASFDTIESNHRAASEDMKKPRERPVMGMGLHDDNPMRFDIEEALAMVGLDVLINSIVNTWGETVAVFTGEPTATYAAAVQEAKANYLTPLTGDKDIVIANTFAKANEANIGVAIAYPALKQSGGDVVLITNSPDGQVTHYLMGNFGRMTTTPLRIVTEIPPFVNHLIVYSEYPDIAGMGYIGESGRVLYMDNWDDVLRTLQQFHRDEVKVAVYPSSEIQYCA